MKKKLALILASVMLMATLAGCGGPASSGTTDNAGEAYSAEWKFAHNENQTGTMQIYAEKFKSLVEEKSGGNITVSIYPSGTLGAGDSIIELLQGGGLEFAVADSGYTGSFVPESQLFRVHFLLSDDAAINRQLLDGEAMQMLNDKFADNGMLVMQHYDAGMTHWTGNKAFRTVEDLQGVKMRTVPAPILISAYTAYGAEPTAVNYSELYSALQLGMAEAQENPLSTIPELGLTDVQSVLTMSGHYPFIHTCVANTEFYNNLPDDVKAMLDEVFDEMAIYIQGAMADYEASVLADIEAEGKMEIVYLTDDEKEAFRIFNEENREVLRESLGDSGMEIMRAIEAEKAALMG